MLTRLSISNFRCLDNFSLEFGGEVLIVGRNGSGKSTVLDAISKLQRLISGRQPLRELFLTNDLTGWTTLETMTFEIQVQTSGHVYDYTLTIRVPRTSPNTLGALVASPAIQSERLEVDAQEVLVRDSGTQVRLGDAKLDFQFPPDFPVISMIQGTGDLNFTNFIREVSQWVIVRPNAMFMKSESAEPVRSPDKFLLNAIGWFQYLQQNGKWVLELRNLLKSIWPEFENIQIENLSKQSNALLLHFDAMEEDPDLNLYFGQLSDGEKMLLALYMIVAHMRVNAGSVVFIDEPDNFLGLSEIQPWLTNVLNSLSNSSQIVIASHHPEIADAMQDQAILLTRRNHSSGTQVRSITKSKTGLKLSEQLSLGWEEDDD